MKKTGLTIIMVVIFVSSVMAQSPSTTLRPRGIYLGIDTYWALDEGYDVIDYGNIYYSIYDFADMFTFYLGYNRETIKNLDLYGEFIFSSISWGDSTILRGRIGTAYNISTGIGNLSLGLEPMLILNPFNIIAYNFILGLDAGHYGGAIKIINRVESSDFIDRIDFSCFFHSRSATIGLGLTISIPISYSISDVGLIIIPEINGGQVEPSWSGKFYIQFPIKKQDSFGGNYFPTGISIGLRLSFDPSNR
jgi:hypothetical protein